MDDLSCEGVIRGVAILRSLNEYLAACAGWHRMGGRSDIAAAFPVIVGNPSPK